jgi:hypothetical protein
MNVVYTVRAHETLYAGTRFRSRLEARWAAFFDLCGWRWEYEPLDLNGWMPDFVLLGAAEILVEVKPVFTFDIGWCGGVTKDPLPGVSDKVAKASRETGREALIVGAHLMASESGLAVGALFEQAAWTFGTFLAFEERADFCSETGSYHGRMTGGYEGRNGFLEYHTNGSTLSEKTILEWWAEAGNRTRWRARR